MFENTAFSNSTAKRSVVIEPYSEGGRAGSTEARLLSKQASRRLYRQRPAGLICICLSLCRCAFVVKSVSLYLQSRHLQHALLRVRARLLKRARENPYKSVHSKRL